MVGEALHKVARKNAVWILDDSNFALYLDQTFLDPGRSLDSYNLKDGVSFPLI